MKKLIALAAALALSGCYFNRLTPWHYSTEDLEDATESAVLEESGRNAEEEDRIRKSARRVELEMP